MKYNSIFHTFFFLVRKKVYGSRYFPQKYDELWITKENFNRVPKGTTVLYVEKALFLDVLPERKGKNVSDDTLIFHKMIFDRDILLLRHNRLCAEYVQRTDLRSIIPWLFHRGTRFSDYYLRPGGDLFYTFFAVIFLLFVVCAGLTCLASVGSQIFAYLMGLIGVICVVTTIYLSENVRDFIIVLFVFPFLMFIFGSGIVRFWFLFFVKENEMTSN